MTKRARMATVGLVVMAMAGAAGFVGSAAAADATFGTIPVGPQVFQNGGEVTSNDVETNGEATIVLLDAESE